MSTVLELRAPRCAVADCVEPVAVEIYDADYAIALSLFCGHSLNRKTCSRRPGDFRIYLCDHHQMRDPRARGLRWQELMLFS
jgi:hypothetical protein